jgi:hypothetical protein
MNKIKTILGRFRVFPRAYTALASLAAIAFYAGSFPADAKGPINIVIEKLDDLNLGTWGGQGNLSDYSDHCVASTTGTFSITATGDGPGGAYQLSSGAATLPFHLYYREKKNAAFVEIPAGTPISSFKGEHKPEKCKHEKQRLEVRLYELDMAQVPPGAYSGNLVVMVTPL